MSLNLTQLLLKERTLNIPKSDIQKALAFKTPSMKAVERAYTGALLRLQSRINIRTRVAIQDPKKVVLRQDAVDPIDAIFLAIGKMIASMLNDPLVMDSILRIGTMVSGVNYRKYDKGLFKRIDINGLPLGLEQQVINNWVKSNVNLITKTNANQTRALESLFRDSAFSGVRAKQLEQSINKIFKGSRNNVKLIARDQVAKLGGQLDMLKQQNAGIDGYYWRGTRDERERLKHAAREGQYFRWDSPPPGGHPGFEYQCRCDAEPAVDKMLLSRKEWKEERAAAAPENKRLRDQAIAKAKAGPLNKPRKRVKRLVA